MASSSNKGKYEPKSGETAPSLSPAVNIEGLSPCEGGVLLPPFDVQTPAAQRRNELNAVPTGPSEMVFLRPSGRQPNPVQNWAELRRPVAVNLVDSKKTEGVAEEEGTLGPMNPRLVPVFPPSPGVRKWSFRFGQQRFFW